MPDETDKPGNAISTPERLRGALNAVFGGSISNIPLTDPAITKAFKDNRSRNAHYSAIGQVAANWAYFEGVIDTWLAIFADVETEVGVCFTGQMIGPNPRLNAFIALVRHRGAKRKWNKQLEQLALDVTKLAEQRNRAVHDVWDLSEAEDPRRLEVTARKTVRVVHVHVPTEDLRRLAKYIDALRQKFDDIAEGIFNEMHLSPHTSPDITPPDGAN